MADQFLDRPSVQALLSRFVGQQIVGPQVLQPVAGVHQGLARPAHDDDIEDLTLARHVLLYLHQILWLLGPGSKYFRPRASLLPVPG